jgi:hypothetical protein
MICDISYLWPQDKVRHEVAAQRLRRKAGIAAPRLAGIAEKGAQGIEKTASETKLHALRDDISLNGLPMTARHEEKARAAATRVARESYGKLVAYLAAPAPDVPGAEDALADEGRAGQSRRLAGEDGVAPAHRRRSADAECVTRTSRPRPVRC